MKSYLVTAMVVIAGMAMLSPDAALGQLYSNDFEIDDTANWQMNQGPIAPDPLGFGPDATHDANFFFDYSTVGIPLAPNSAAGGTRGIKLQTNNDFNFDGVGVFTGMSVSPMGQDFSSAGDYKLTFDWWANTIGPMPTGGSGSTQLSTFGIGTNGTVAQWPGGSQNSVWFGMTGDGQSSADWRAYSPTTLGRFSYQEPDGTFVYEADPNDGPVRQNTNPYYADFGSVEPPAAQAALYSSQTGTTAVGSAAFEWHEVEITKTGDDISWTVDGVLIATVNLNDPNDSGPITLSGGNIFFGHSDINTGPSTDANRFDLLFTLIDNVTVEALAAPGLEGDYNDDGTVDAADYVVWRKNAGTTNTLPNDPNGGEIGAAQYNTWVANFGDSNQGGGGNAAAAVPEPATWALAMISLAFYCASSRRRARVQ